MSDLKDSGNASDARSQIRRVWWGLVCCLVALFVILTVFWAMNKAHRPPHRALTSPWLRSHAVVAMPWVVRSRTSHDSIAICGDGELYGLSPADADTLTEYSKARVIATRSLAADYQQPPFVTGLACSQDGVLFALNLDDETVMRIPVHGPANLDWGSTDWSAQALALRSDGSLLVATSTLSSGPWSDSGEIVRVSAQGTREMTWAFVETYPAAIAVAADDTTYVSYWNSPTITRISPNGVSQAHWLTLPATVPAGTPAKIRPRGLCANRRSDTSSYLEALDRQGDLYVAGGTTTSATPGRLVKAGCLWRVTPKGVVAQWVLSTPDGKPVPLWSIAVGNDGTVYGASTSPSIVRLTFPAR